MALKRVWKAPVKKEAVTSEKVAPRCDVCGGYALFGYNFGKDWRCGVHKDAKKEREGC